MEHKLHEAAAALPETTLEFADIQQRANGKRPALFLPLRRAAIACLALLLFAGIVGVTAEALEYREAAVFFSENDLLMDGLTRAEIKAIYRDITTKSFT